MGWFIINVQMQNTIFKDKISPKQCLNWQRQRLTISQKTKLSIAKKHILRKDTMQILSLINWDEL